MKRLLLLLLLCATSVYAKEFPDGLNDTKWKQTDLKDKKNYSTWEFSGRFYTIRVYKNNKLESVTTHEMSNYQVQNDLLFVWYDGMTYPDIYEMKYDLTKYGRVVLIHHVINAIDKNSLINSYTPLAE